MLIQPQMPQQHTPRQNHRRRIRLILPLDIQPNMTTPRLKNSHLATHIAPGNDPRPAHQRSPNVGQNASVQIRHDHDVKLLRARNGLHRGVVDNHVIHLERGVVLCRVVKGAAEEAVGELHDVGLVDARNLVTPVRQRKRKRKLGDALALSPRDDLEGLHHARHALVLQPRVLSLGILPDDAQIHILVTRLVAGDILDQADARIDIQFLTQRHIETLMSASRDGRVQDSLEGELVALEGGDGLAKGSLCAGAAAGFLDARDGDLLPLDGDVVGLEDCLYGFGDLGTDAVTGDEGDGVFAAVFGGFEDVGLDRGEGAGELGLTASATQGLVVLISTAGFSKLHRVEFVVLSHLSIATGNHPSTNHSPAPPEQNHATSSCPNHTQTNVYLKLRSSLSLQVSRRNVNRFVRPSSSIG